MSLDPSSLFAGVVFSGIGVAAWLYGRRQQSARPMLLGVVLIGLPFVLDGYMLWAAGAVASLLVVWP